MKSIMKKGATFARGHKIISIIIVVAAAGGGYAWYRAANAAPAVTAYVVEAASKSTVVQSVSGTGQVQAGATIDVTPKVSGTVTSIPISVGQHVAEGQLLVQLDPTTEAQAVRADKLSLENAQLSLDQLQQITTTTLLSDQNAVRQGTVNLTTASNTVTQDYETGYDSLGSAFTDLQTVMTGLQSFVNGNDLSATQYDPDAYLALMPEYLRAPVVPYKDEVQSTYQAAHAAYQQDLADYHATSRTGSQATLNSLFKETLDAANQISSAVKASKGFITEIVNSYPNSSSTKPLPPITATLQNDFNTYTNTITSAVSSVQSTINSITTDKNNYANDRASLTQASATLAELVGGPTQAQLLSAQISVQSAQNNLTTAEQNLADTSVRAPIAGTISAINATVGASSGSDAVTMVGDGEVAQVTLNEIDIAKVQVGDPATLTFDAINGLSLAGKVVEIDPVGTVSQGVVSYNVQIGFNQPSSTPANQLVKPGMSVTANIVTSVAQNVIAVPNSAITSAGGTSYVTEPTTPLSASALAASASGGVALPQGTKRVPVTTGITNNTMTEITSGIQEGDQIVTQTMQSASAGASAAVGGASGGNAFQLLGGARGGGGGFGGGARGGYRGG